MRRPDSELRLEEPNEYTDGTQIDSNPIELVTAAACNNLDVLRAEIDLAISSCRARIAAAETKGPLPFKQLKTFGDGTTTAGSSLVSERDGELLPWKTVELQENPEPAKKKDGVGIKEPWIISAELSVARGLHFPDADNAPSGCDLGRQSRSGLKETVMSSLRLFGERRYKTGCSKFCRRLVHSAYFDAASAVAILLNSIFLSLTVDIAAQEDASLSAGQPPAGYVILARVFTIWFAIEVAIRFGAEGWRFFSYRSKDWTWNVFDIFVVGSDVVETFVELVVEPEKEALGSLIALRVLRVLRITRAIRVVRLVRFFRELRMMVFSILRSGWCLVWSLVMLYLIVFIAGIYFTQNVTEYRKEQAKDGNTKSEEDVELIQKLEDMFGSITLSHYTLFQAVSGGVSWGEISDSLRRIHWSNGVIMCFFVFFTVFAVMNIITGIFVDTATHAAHADREEVIQGQLEAEDATLWQLRTIFVEADMDHSGTITAEEFEVHLADLRVRAHLQALGLDINEARGLFVLLDLGQTGDVVIDEFVTGCMRLKGNAKTLDMQMLMYENKRMFGKLMAFFDYTNEHFAHLKRFEKRVENVLEKLVYVLYSSQFGPRSYTELAGDAKGVGCENEHSSVASI